MVLSEKRTVDGDLGSEGVSHLAQAGTAFLTLVLVV